MPPVYDPLEVLKRVDIDLSSDDEDELKTIRDQVPEGVTLATTSTPGKYGSPKLSNSSRPGSLGAGPKKKIMPNLDLLKDNELDDALSDDSSDSSGGMGLSLDDEKTPDDLNTPDVLNNSVFDGELGWRASDPPTPAAAEPIPVYTAQEELEDDRNWRTVQIGDKVFRIDLKVIEPYKKVLSHGGYYGDGFNAIVVFTACYLPDKRRRDYHYVMDNLFLYVISTLELLVVEDYMIVYFHGATPKHKMPGLRWLKRCYDMIDRRLKKNLKGLLVIHPTLWLKTLVFMTRPFVSSKFTSKMKYISSLHDLTKALPTEFIFIPDEVKEVDEYSNRKKPIPRKKFINY